MKIGIISHLKYPIKEPFAGGLEMHTYALADGLIQRGHQVRVFAPADSDECLNIEPMRLSALDYESYRDREPNVEYFSEQFVQEHHAYMDLMSRLVDEEFDVIQNNSLNYIPVSMSNTISAPMVTTLHTPPITWLQSAVKCERRHGKMRYVTVSGQNAKAWQSLVSVDQVIHNGINLDKWRFSPRADTGLAVWFGRITPEKGTHLAIQAAHHAGLRLWLAGPICDQEYFDEHVAPLLNPQDKYLGHLSHRELIDVIGMGSVFLCTPCWEEPYGLVVAEALACGTPVAAFRRGAMSEIITEETGRLATPNDIESLAQAAIEATQLDRKACRQRAENFCSMQHMVDQYVDLYTSLTNPIEMICQTAV
ncbi:MAG: glycosyltransferase family 4 protein [Tunicatimonas sp.]|uniref:glycosyltransferase family 4 protein n=1 Tax=Tunicatimonas sp. TaxID=1940096 RepID=UPI003C78B4AF